VGAVVIVFALKEVTGCGVVKDACTIALEHACSHQPVVEAIVSGRQCERGTRVGFLKAWFPH
jgi:hypothetical protein